MLGLSVAGALLCFGWLESNSRQDKDYRAQIERLHVTIDDLNGKGQQVQQQLTPDEQNLLIAAHKLVANKNFVWSRLFSDLESVLPGSVSASKISVKNVFSEGDQIRRN